MLLITYIIIGTNDKRNETYAAQVIASIGFLNDSNCRTYPRGAAYVACGKRGMWKPIQMESVKSDWQFETYLRTTASLTLIFQMQWQVNTYTLSKLNKI